METLLHFGNIPVNHVSLQAVFPELNSVKDKISDLEKRGVVIRLKRGLYVISKSITGLDLSLELIANHLYGPSYVSMESALRFYGLIPESVYSTYSMTLKRSRSFKNSLGYFEYISCQPDYYSIGITQVNKKDYAFLMASREKALCDLIAYTPNLRLRSIKSLQLYLEEDLRLDMDEFYKMNVSILEECAEVSKKKADIKNIINLLRQ
jgi:predicted transcriptional regulator of viral defense system